jgi:hypothetical protein
VVVEAHREGHCQLRQKAADRVFHAGWEKRFLGAHGFELAEQLGEDRYWITNHDRQVVSMCTSNGRELRRLGPEKVLTHGQIFRTPY